jgi:hypothetical protein
MTWLHPLWSQYLCEPYVMLIFVTNIKIFKLDYSGSRLMWSLLMLSINKLTPIDQVLNNCQISTLFH